MTNIYPSYYKDFACITSACRHNCCIGWEIDIDSDTYEKYMKTGGEMGERLKNCCSASPVPHFVCRDDGRCPFLNSDNLCDIIIKLGKDSLCSICAAHPRFTNELSGRLEHGLGLCCEEAARLILGRKEKLGFICEEDCASPFCDEVIALRDRLIRTFQDRSRQIDERCRDALAMCRISLPERSMAEWAQYFLALERLDGVWGELLESLGTAVDETVESRFREHMRCREHEWEQLLVYFIWRHAATAADTEDVSYRCAFAVLSYRLIYALSVGMFAKNGSFTFEDMAELCRLYSAEIEYSEENTEAVLDELYFFCVTE